MRCRLRPLRQALRAAGIESGEDRPIRTEIWIEGKVVSFRALAVERDIVVLNNGRAELR